MGLHNTFISPEFRVQYLAFYQLNVFVTHKEEQILVVDDQHEVIAFFAYPSGKVPTSVSKLLSLPFKSVTIYMQQHNLVCIPSEVFDKEDVTIYGSYFTQESSDAPRYMHDERSHATFVYNFCHQTYEAWKTLYPHAEVVPLFSIFNALHAIHPSQLQLTCTADVLQIVLFAADDQQQLVACTLNKVEGEQDVLFHVLKVLENFGVDAVNSVSLFGFVKEDQWGDAARSLFANTQVQHLELAGESAQGLPEGASLLWNMINLTKCEL